MRAVVYDAYGATPTVREVVDPVCPEDGVVVAVEATGVCRSDHHAWLGHDPVPLPMTPGHEFAGRVAAVGAAVTGWAVGDRVTAPFVIACGACDVCAAGDQQVCPHQVQPGFTYSGSWATHVAVPAAAANLVRLPDAVDAVAAAALGCRFATAYRALRTHGQVAAGQTVAVHGCGGVGLSAVMIAVALGAEVVAVDPSPAARAVAAELGATRVLDPAAVDTVAEIVAVTGRGAHVSLDAVGTPATASASVRCLRPRGRHVQVGLLLGEQAAAPVHLDRVVALELSLHGSHGMPAPQYDELLAMIEDGRLDPARLVRRRLRLDEAPAALAGLDRADAAGISVVIPT